MQFSELNLSDEVLKAVEELGFSEATEIQEKSIPLLMEGRDVIGRSNTGTGKTAAFGIPAIERISREEKKGVEVLILCPTRELAMQACDEIKKFSKYMKWVKPCAVYGGASMEKQIHELKRGANIVVGTPGRVMDHMDRRTLKLGNLKTIILDEADEMLNMGFREDIENILRQIPQERQTVLFSATMPPAIMAITNEYQNNPEIIKIANKQKTVDTIEQYWFEVAMGRKTDALRLLLLAYEPKASMIFCNTKKMVDELTETLCAKGFKAGGLHGDMKQAQRTQVMDRFKNGKISVLIATDVAARGIDVSGVDVVFNYDLPQDNEYYIHRIGRTGRAGKSGIAYTLISGRKQVYEMKAIARYVKADIIQKELPTRDDVIKNKLQHISEKVVSYTEQPVNPETEKLMAELQEKGITAEQIARAFINRRINKEMKAIPEFDMPVPLKRDSSGKKTKTVKVDISVGRMHRIAPNFILGALVDATGMSGKSFGKIDIFDRHTTVEVPDADKDFVIESMNNGKINGNRVTVKLYEGKERRQSSAAPDRNRKNYSDRNRFNKNRNVNRNKKKSNGGWK
ncbi:MAG TPA: DNA/RNA helicase [Ruminococcus sp.]|nr:DNA/RNA helicase [Ruminococcus sp.]HBN10444.1 DNA/RNA helicase [Ruminococcus sp.]HCR74763.1 DNA/RNA helicase [Ruminococcus sp.]